MGMPGMNLVHSVASRGAQAATSVVKGAWYTHQAATGAVMAPVMTAIADRQAAKAAQRVLEPITDVVNAVSSQASTTSAIGDEFFLSGVAHEMGKVAKTNADKAGEEFVKVLKAVLGL